MKKLIAIAIAALASSASATVLGSPHDMQLKGGTRSVCVYCHAAHKGVGGNAPLWNRTATTTTFTQLSARDTSGVARAVTGAKTLLCLSCHDATVNLGSTLTNAETFASPAGDIANYAIVGGNRTAVGGASAGVLGNLDSDHPVSLPYSVTATTTGATLFARADAEGNLGLSAGALATIECSSCHDPHTTANSKFLRVAAADICTQCHNK
jgi:predicted CXXCH cytochrome family protein